MSHFAFPLFLAWPAVPQVPSHVPEPEPCLVSSSSSSSRDRSPSLVARSVQRGPSSECEPHAPSQPVLMPVPLVGCVRDHYERHFPLEDRIAQCAWLLQRDRPPSGVAVPIVVERRSRSEPRLHFLVLSGPSGFNELVDAIRERADLPVRQPLEVSVGGRTVHRDDGEGGVAELGGFSGKTLAEMHAAFQREDGFLHVAYRVTYHGSAIRAADHTLGEGKRRGREAKTIGGEVPGSCEANSGLDGKVQNPTTAAGSTHLEVGLSRSSSSSSRTSLHGLSSRVSGGSPHPAASVPTRRQSSQGLLPSIAPTATQVPTTETAVVPIVTLLTTTSVSLRRTPRALPPLLVTSGCQAAECSVSHASSGGESQSVRRGGDHLPTCQRGSRYEVANQLLSSESETSSVDEDRRAPRQAHVKTSNARTGND